MTKEILIKFLNNNCTETELSEVLRWVKEEALTKKGHKLGLDDWNNYHDQNNLEDSDKFPALFDRIQDEIYRRESVKKQDKIPGMSIFTKWLTRAAAILLLPVLIMSFYTLFERITINNLLSDVAIDSLEVIAPIGSRTVVQLSDGSEVHLNYGSRIKYPQFFSDDIRELELEGEAFFKVAHNPQKPFVVKTKNLNVKALGTSFNVLAYPGDKVVQTTLVRGKVILEQEGLKGETVPIGAMVPGQHVKYNLEQKKVTHCSRGQIEKYIAWVDGKLIFRDAPITEVVEKLSRMFNVDIQVDNEIEDYLYTVTLIDEPLFQILDLMCIATPIKYETLPREKLPDGTFSKQKIKIEKKQ